MSQNKTIVPGVDYDNLGKTEYTMRLSTTSIAVLVTTTTVHTYQVLPLNSLKQKCRLVR